MKNALARHWPMVVALGALGIVVAVVYALCVRDDGGRFVYAIDDIYITMSVARNFAWHAVWGVTPYEFSSSESTIIWPLLLTLSYKLGINSELVSLLLNILFAGGTLLIVYVILRNAGMPQRYQAAALLAMTFLAALPTMIFTGMEHSLQIGCSLLFVYLVARELTKQEAAHAGAWIWLLAAVMSLIRYEGLFLVFAACVLFLARKRWVEAFGLGLVAWLPIVIYGAISVHHGWHWLPNSVYLKAKLPHFIGGPPSQTFLGNGGALMTGGDVWSLGIALLMLLALLAYQQRTIWNETSVMVVLFTIAAALHLRFARFGWFFRYEAYLLALGVLVFALGAFAYLSTRRARMNSRLETSLAGIWLGCSLLCFFALALRGYVALSRIPRASHNIYEQQYQMGLFVRQFYRGASIAANDIGAVSYLGEPRLEDLWGLGSLDVANLKLAGGLSAQQIDRITRSRGTRIAILHDGLFEDRYTGLGGLPAEWIRVGSWEVPDNYICAYDTVSFYAVNSAEEGVLIAHLRQFASRLPSGIEQSGKYLQAD